MPNNARMNVEMTETALFSLLDDAASAPVILTGNPRAAHALRIRYGLWQQRGSKHAWRTPDIFPWDTWLAELWNGLLMSGTVRQILLSPIQELHLWQDLILPSNATEDGRIRYSDSLAEIAQSALAKMEEYEISVQQMEQAAAGKDATAFLSWLQAFHALCDDKNFSYPSALARTLAQQLAATQLSLPKQLFLVGFDRIAPDQMRLLNQLQAKGCDAAFLSLTPESAAEKDRAVIMAETADEEIFAAACWIRRRLNKNPNQRIGVLTPSLNDSRNLIDQIFRTVLAPSTFNLHASSQQLPYEFTLGTQMTRLPQIQAALLLLRWISRPIRFEEASFLLLSGHIGNSSPDARARLDATIRNHPKLLNPEPDFSWLLRLLQTNTKNELAPLLVCIQNVAIVARKAGIFTDRTATTQRRTYAEWVGIIEQILSASEWDLLRGMSSAEFQILTRWNRMLDEIVKLDVVATRPTFPEALEKITAVAAQILYAQETQNAPVQIMGIAESAGLIFDGIWFLNASANAWPAKGNPQSWIPWILQRSRKMPFTDAEANYEFARGVTHRIDTAAQAIIYSFALEDDAAESSSSCHSGTMLQASPILQDLFPAVLPMLAMSWLPEIPEYAHSSDTDKTIPVLSEYSVPFRTAKVAQGVNFLKQQAACPFKAFAEMRLVAAPLPYPSIGLAANTQGSLMHGVLRTFWSEVKDQLTLRSLQGNQRLEILDSHIQRALAELNTSSTLEIELVSTEAELLRNRLLAWLEVEEHRPEFSVVDGEKTLKDVWIGDIQFDCRIDRIDLVGHGLALIDYKTGKATPKACDGDRPDEPQLPAYAVLLQDQISSEKILRGVAIASLQANDIGFKIVHSLSQTFSQTDPKNTKWRTPILREEAAFLAQLDVWEQTLRHLADNFRAGIFTVDPKIPGITCTHCSQSTLCRIAEIQSLSNSTEDEERENDGIV